MEKYEIIDFHTHPFMLDEHNICVHTIRDKMATNDIKPYFESLGISKICGSVVYNFSRQTELGCDSFDPFRRLNDTALELRDMFGDFYVPGFHINPLFYEESCREIERMDSLGVKLVGELVPYLHGWDDFASDSFSALVDEIERRGMILNVHTMSDDSFDRLVEAHPNTVIVAAHPGDFGAFTRQMNRMAMSKNYYVDVSGSGLFRFGLLREGIDRFGAERFLFGSDYPICTPSMFIGGVAYDPLITEDEKKLILADNAKRILGI